MVIADLFSLQFELVSNISLTEVSKSSDPTLCVAKQLPINFNEKYSRKLSKGKYSLSYIATYITYKSDLYIIRRCFSDLCIHM